MRTAIHFVVVESPYAPPKGASVDDAALILARNLAYVRAAMHDSFLRGEVPFASHALYTQAGVLDDTIPGQRKQGIEGGFAVAAALACAATAQSYLFEFSRAFYINRGWSSGMILGRENAEIALQKAEIRELDKNWGRDYDRFWTLNNGVLVRK
jgi:hypothetical protein